MDWFEFLLGLLGALVWPAVAVAAILLFQDPIRKLLPRVQQVEIAGFKAVLEKAKEDAAEGATGPNFPMPTPRGAFYATGDAGSREISIEEVLSEVVQLPTLTLPAVAEVPADDALVVAQDPLTGIRRAWSALEVAAHDRARRLAGERSADLMGALEAVQKHARAPVELYRLVFRLEELEEIARKVPASTISRDEAMEYAKLARRATLAFTMEGPA